MTIHFAGGEDIDFNSALYSTVDTTAGHRDADYSDCAIRVTDNTTGELRTFPFAAITNGWLHAKAYCSINTAYVRDHRLLGLTDANGYGIYVGLSGNSNAKEKAAIWRRTSSGHTRLAEESGNTLNTGLRTIDMQISNYGENGTVNVFFNGSLLFSYTGDIRVSGVTEFTCISGYQDGGYASPTGLVLSELIVATVDTRAMRVKTRRPASTHADNEWNGEYNDINEVSNSLANVVNIDTVDKNCIMELGDRPSGDWSIVAECISVSAVAPSGPTANKLKLGLLKNTVADLDTGQNLAGAWSGYRRIIETSIDVSDDLQLLMRSAAS